MLFYRTPPANWMEGLPVGNGRLAAMIFGAEEDVIALNHEWLWRGKNRFRENKPAGVQCLEEVRELLQKGSFLEATELANRYFAGEGGVSGKPGRVDAYQPAGNVIFKLDEENRFSKRMLDIEKGICTVVREQAKNQIELTSFADVIHQHIVCRWQAEQRFSGTLLFCRAEDSEAETKLHLSKKQMVFDCKFRDGIAYKAVTAIHTDGCVSVENGKIHVQDAVSLVLEINIATEVSGIEEELQKYPVCIETDFDSRQKAHMRKFSAIMGRFSLSIEGTESSLPTDERIQRLKAGERDDRLMLLYFDYGRYLLVSSSICGQLPANLQGKWNEEINPPWQSDYHFDINLQMNYWMAEAVNMPECAETLLDFTDRFLPHARKAAKELYGCNGICFPLQTDAWGRSTPESYGWAAWIGAAPWIAQHYWKHYIYNGNTAFLKERAYPFFKETVRFYEDYLVLDANGIYQIMPSQSPENRFAGTGDFPVSIGISSAMDVQLAYDCLGYAIKASEILGVDPEQREVWKKIRKHLPPFSIGKDGRLLEWEKEREEIEPGHRHVSHLYGLYPSDLFNPEERKPQYEAAEKSLEYRLSCGGGHTGWSRAWVACLYARLGKGEQLYEHIAELMKEFATVSLLDLHPPRIFQIDGNLGAVAAVIEGIAQFWAGRLHLLRALPPGWENGSVKGLKTPGGHLCDFTWKDGKITFFKAKIGYCGTLILCCNGKEIKITGVSGQEVEIEDL